MRAIFRNYTTRPGRFRGYGPRLAGQNHTHQYILPEANAPKARLNVDSDGISPTLSHPHNRLKLGLPFKYSTSPSVVASPYTAFAIKDLAITIRFAGGRPCPFYSYAFSSDSSASAHNSHTIINYRSFSLNAPTRSSNSGNKLFRMLFHN